MIEYFNVQMFKDAYKQRKKTLIVLYCIVAIYVLISIGLVIWFSTLPYASQTITTIKIIHYSLTFVGVLFCSIYLGIVYKRVNRFFRLTGKMYNGIKETSTGSFLEYDQSMSTKDGVDVKSLIFVEWNKYKNDFFERKVFVFYELPFPQIEVGANVKYVTQGNVLISYEILS